MTNFKISELVYL